MNARTDAADAVVARARTGWLRVSAGDFCETAIRVGHIVAVRLVGSVGEEGEAWMVKVNDVNVLSTSSRAAARRVYQQLLEMLPEG